MVVGIYNKVVLTFGEFLNDLFRAFSLLTSGTFKKSQCFPLTDFEMELRSLKKLDSLTHYSEIYFIDSEIQGRYLKFVFPITNYLVTQPILTSQTTALNVLL